MVKVILASNSNNKYYEASNFMKEFDIEVVTPSMIGINVDSEETGDTYEENAIIKAKAVSNIISKMPEYKNTIIIGDDSGLEIDALKGFPGLKSNRFMGQTASIDERINYILNKMEKVDHTWKRSAKFICKIAVYVPDDDLGIEDPVVFTGTLNGFISFTPMYGPFGYAYDPIMYMPEYGRSCAQIGWEEKKKISHRCIALGKVVRFIKNSIKGGLINETITK